MKVYCVFEQVYGYADELIGIFANFEDAYLESSKSEDYYVTEENVIGSDDEYLC